MWCYFFHGGRIAGVEVLPPGLSDEDAVARAQILSQSVRARLMATSCGTAPVWSSGVQTRAQRRPMRISRGCQLADDFRREKAQLHAA